MIQISESLAHAMLRSRSDTLAKIGRQVLEGEPINIAHHVAHGDALALASRLSDREPWSAIKALILAEHERLAADPGYRIIEEWRRQSGKAKGWLSGGNFMELHKFQTKHFPEHTTSLLEVGR